MGNVTFELEVEIWRTKRSRISAVAPFSSCLHLVRAKKPRAKAREREKGVADGLKDPTMMGGLIRAITGNDTYVYEKSLKDTLIK